MVADERARATRVNTVPILLRVAVGCKVGRRCLAWETKGVIEPAHIEFAPVGPDGPR